MRESIFIRSDENDEKLLKEIENAGEVETPLAHSQVMMRDALFNTIKYLMDNRDELVASGRKIVDEAGVKASDDTLIQAQVYQLVMETRDMLESFGESLYLMKNGERLIEVYLRKHKEWRANVDKAGTFVG